MANDAERLRRPFRLLLLGLVAIVLVSATTDAETLQTVNSTAKDREAVRLTIYDDRALVSETRRVELPKGRSILVFADVPGTIDATSVQLLSMGREQSFSVVEQNYKKAGITTDSLLRDSIGKDVVLIEKERRTKGRLLAPGIYEIEGQVLIGYQGSVLLPGVPKGLSERPVLSCVIEARNRGKHTVELTYLASGISWKGFYTATISEDESSMSLRGLISIANWSGSSYQDARVSVVAGSVNLSRDEVPRPEMQALKMAGSPMPGAQIAPQQAFEYHVYALPGPVTLERDQQKQVGFISADRCRLSKRYQFDWSYNSGRAEPERESAKIVLRIENNEASGLGMPLPQGKVRVCQRLKGLLLLIGEDSIGNVPQGERFELQVGKAFDVVAEQKRTSSHSLGREGEEASFSVSVSNRKEKAITVIVGERIPGDWKMLESSADYERVTANRVEFKLDVGANEEKTIQFSVRVSRRY
ncbi:MAG TPA: DUF4139 domain-containing protein [bacterium]|nr:DUF4139 domain-containing protein [bacterium]